MDKPVIEALEADENTVLADLCAVIGMHRTLAIAAWWGGRNIVIPATRPRNTRIARVIGEDAAERLAQAFGGMQVFIPRMRWFSRINTARQAWAMHQRGFSLEEIERLLVLAPNDARNMVDMGRFVDGLAAGDTDFPPLQSTGGGRRKKR